MVAQPHPPAGRQCAQAQVDIGFAAQARQCRLQLVEQGGADLARPDHRQRQRLRRQPECGVRGAQSAGGIFGGDRDRDVAFGRTLGDRADVDPRTRQCGEQLRGHAGLAGHAVADRGQHADPGHDLHALHLATVELTGERIEQGATRGFGIALAHDRADRMLGRALRDHHHRNPRGMQRGEHALRRARHTDQARAFQADQGKAGIQREALDRPAMAAIAIGIDTGAGEFGLEGIAHQDRQAARDRRGHRLRVDHLRAEVGQLAGLAVAHRPQRDRFRHQPWVRREHAVDIRPDVQLGGIEQGGEDRAGKIAAVAAEHGRQAVLAAGDEAGGNHARLRVGGAPRRQPACAFVPIDHRAQLCMADQQHVARIKQGVVCAACTQVRLQQHGRQHFAHALDAVQRRAPRLAQQRHRAQQVGDVAEARVDPCMQRDRRIQQGTGGVRVLGAQGRPRGLPVFAGRGRIGHRDQRIGGALHRRDHDDLTRFLRAEHQRRDMADAAGVGQRTAAELVRATRRGLRNLRRNHGTSGGGPPRAGEGIVAPASVAAGP